MTVFSLLALVCSAPCAARQVGDPCAGYAGTLEAMSGADLALRRHVIALMGAPVPDEKQIRKTSGQIELVDRINTAKLVRLVKTCGWPRRSVHGERAAEGAWLIAQHADADVDTQRALLEHVKRAVDAGEAAPHTYAYLVDRIALNEGKPQRYGTQAENKSPCDLVIVPLDDHRKADERRRKIGWPPLKDYVRLLTGHLKEAGCPAPSVVIGS